METKMAKEVQQIMLIDLDQLHPRPGNRKAGGISKESLEELASSIKEKGVLRPLIVRTNEDHFEIIAGEHRWKASRMAGLTSVPCQVREMDDAEANEIALIDNLHHADLHPLDEAETYALIFSQVVDQSPDAGVDVVAAKVGKPIRYVVQRIQLTHLVSSARELWRKDERMTLGHALLICKMPANIQEKMSKLFKGNGYHYALQSLSNFQDFIQRELYMELARVPWKKEDSGLLPGAGSCLKCVKRTGANATLFPEIGKKDNCLDSGCYAKKLDAHVARVREQLKGRPHLIVSTEYYQQPKGSLSTREWARCEKGDRGALECLVIDGHERGHVIWGKKRTGDNGRSLMTEVEKAKRKKDIETNQIRRQTAVKVLERTMDGLQKAAMTETVLDDVLRVVALWLFTRANQRVIATHYSWTEQKTVHRWATGGSYTVKSFEPAAKAAITNMGVPELQIFMAKCLSDSAMGKDPMLTDELRQLAAVANVEISDIEKEVRKAISEEKASKEAKKKVSAKKETRKPAKNKRLVKGKKRGA